MELLYNKIVKQFLTLFIFTKKIGSRKYSSMSRYYRSGNLLFLKSSVSVGYMLGRCTSFESFLSYISLIFMIGDLRRVHILVILIDFDKLYHLLLYRSPRSCLAKDNKILAYVREELHEMLFSTSLSAV